MKIFITGGAGFIGSHLCRRLLNENHEVYVYDSLKCFENQIEEDYQVNVRLRLGDIKSRIKIIRGDVREPFLLSRSVRDIEPDVVVHLANTSSVKYSSEHPEDVIRVNVEGTLNVLNCTEDVSSLKKFLYISSSMIYGDFQYLPADEKHPTNPVNMYGYTKLMGEFMVKNICKKRNVNWIILRPSAVYGPNDTTRRIVKIFLENALQNKPIYVEGDGNSQLDFTYVDDCVDGICRALTSNVCSETFNITRGEGRSINELVDIIKKHFSTLKVSRKEGRSDMPVRGSLDIQKARELLGYNPRYSLEDGIEKYLESLRRAINLEGIISVNVPDMEL